MRGLTLGELARRCAAELRGDPELRIEGVAPIGRAGPGEISFVINTGLRARMRGCRAEALILPPELAAEYEGAALVTAEPYLAYAKAAQALHPAVLPAAGVDPRACVDEGVELGPGVHIGACAVVQGGAKIGEGSVIGPGCVIGSDVMIGARCRLGARVAIERGCRLGDRVWVQPGAVIGADGFGFAREGEAWVKIPQIGTVVIGNDVEIGANTTIDRGAMDDTRIGDGVKLDNQIQVAHNVRIGEHTAIAACVGIAGSAVIGRRCTIGGAAGILGHLEIVDDVHITAMSLVTKSILSPGSYSSGTPLEPSARWQRNFVRFKQLDDMARRLRALEKRRDAGDE